MRRIARALVRCAPAAILLLAGARGDAPTLPRLTDGARILALGDSPTRGTGAQRAASYPAVRERLTGREVVASGVPGERAAEGRRPLPGVLERLQPDLLILCHGGNDTLRGTEPAAIEGDLIAMIERAQTQGIAVVLVGVPARGPFADTADVDYRAAERTGVPLEDGIVATLIDSPELRADTVHPNARGYRRLAEAVRALLARARALAER